MLGSSSRVGDEAEGLRNGSRDLWAGREGGDQEGCKASGERRESGMGKLRFKGTEKRE